MGDPLTIEVRHEQDYVIVTAAGEIDISTVTRMRECLFDLAASGRPLVRRRVDPAGVCGQEGCRSGRPAAQSGVPDGRILSS
jgi:hypothetical protein